MGLILEYRFFPLFSPVAGIFVHQALLHADAARQPATVFLAVLGAGMALNEILAKAADTAADLVARRAAPKA